jgi:predicted glycosyltransferase involved in capsule biosynthesis
MLISNNEISLCTTIKNRWFFLKEALKTWVNKGFYDIVIVDWDSEDVDLYNEIKKEYKNIKIIKIINQPFYKSSVSKNIGFTQIRSKYIFFIDCDIKINVDCIGDYTRDKDFYHGSIDTTGSHTTGSCLIERSIFEEVNGYNEEIDFLPIEDRDLYRRLKLRGFKEGIFDKGVIEHIDHNYDTRKKYRPWTENINILYKDWDKEKKRISIPYDILIT